MSIIENWSKIQGTVLSVKESASLKGFSEVELDVERVADVQGYPNLLKEAVGKAITVFVPRDLVERLGIAKDRIVKCRVRRGGPRRMFVHPEFLSVRRDVHERKT